MAAHIRTGDMVMVMCGADRHSKGRVGKVMRIIRGKAPGQDRVIVEGMNLCKKHVRPGAENQQGGVIEKEMPIHISNVMPVVDGKATRVRFKERADGSKVRVAVRGGDVLGTPLRAARP